MLKKNTSSIHKIVKLGSVCKFQGGSQPAKENFVYEETTGYERFVQIRDFADPKKFITYIPKSSKNKKCDYDDILIGRYGASVGTICTGLKGAYNVALIKCINDKNKISNRFLYYYLKSKIIQDKIISLSARAAQAGVNPKHLEEFDLPLPSLKEQSEIVEDLDKYQKIIDGSKQVIQNYKPTIDINPDWEMVDLNEVCEINKNKIGENEINKDKKYIYVDISSLNNKTNEIDFSNIIKGKDLPSRARRIGNNNETIFSSVRPNLKAIAYLEEIKENTIFSTGFMILTPKNNIISKYLYYLVCSEYFTTQLISKMGRGAYPSVNQNDISSIKIYLPTKETQIQVINEIDKITNIVKGNIDLISKMEEKINNSINKIWSN